MKQKFINIRKDILKLSKITGQGRLGTDYSVVELIDTVYQHMRHDPNNPSWDDRDIFVLSKGHASLCYYTILAHNGYFSLEEVKTLKKYKSNFGGHLDRLKVLGAEASTGSLGHGIGLSVGMALGLKIQKSDRKVYVLVGDGESNEGSVWEAIMIAVSEKLDNLVIIFDVNQSQTRCLQLNNISGICREFGCRVEEINGHDESEILDSFNCHTKDKPLVVVANTIKGYPCQTLVDNKFEWHNKVPNEEYYNIFMKELNAKTV
jgi:transketolase